MAGGGRGTGWAACVWIFAFFFHADPELVILLVRRRHDSQRELALHARRAGFARVFFVRRSSIRLERFGEDVARQLRVGNIRVVDMERYREAFSMAPALR